MRRAAVVLFVLSLARLAWDGRAAAIDAPAADPSVLDTLASRTTRVRDEADRRARPLAVDERLDPNVASEIELDRLPGVGPSVAAAIVAARDDGLVFARPEDILQVRGIGPATLGRLRPHLEFSGAAGARSRARASSPPGRGRPHRPHPGSPTLVDLNRAGPAELEGLPGIGPALAARIVEERGLRPFASLADLERVRGIGPAAVARLTGLAHAGRGR